MKQEIIGGAILCAVGLSHLLIPPEIWWHITEQWKTEGAGHPSDRYALLMRVIGIVFAGAGALLIACNL